MIVYLILFILATVGIAIIFNTNLSKNKLLKFGSVGLYFFIIEFLLFIVTEDITFPIIILVLATILAILIFAIRGSFILSAKSKIFKYSLIILSLISVFGLSYILIESIMQPIKFEEEKQERYVAAVSELMDIRIAQTFYKREYGKYTSSIDELRNFILKDSISIVKKEGVIPDSIYLKAGNDLAKAEKICLERKIISRDTSKKSVKDSLFKNFDSKKFGYVPFSENILFEMDTATIESGGIKINLFQCCVTNMVLLDGLNRQLILNLDDDAIEANKYPGIKVGSTEENNNNDGNWDKEIEVIILKNK